MALLSQILHFSFPNNFGAGPFFDFFFGVIWLISSLTPDWPGWLSLWGVGDIIGSCLMGPWWCSKGGAVDASARLSRMHEISGASIFCLPGVFSFASQDLFSEGNLSNSGSNFKSREIKIHKKNCVNIEGASWRVGGLLKRDSSSPVVILIKKGEKIT